MALTKAKSFDDLVFINQNLNSGRMAQSFNVHVNDLSYFLSNIFSSSGNDNKSGRQTLLDRFRSSVRAKEIFGDELHDRICEANFNLVG